MEKAWCYIRQSDGVGCFKNLRPATRMIDWIEGWVLNRKIFLADCFEYNTFVDIYGEIWYFRFEATISYHHPSNFIKHY